MSVKKKAPLNPTAAKILEQYRNSSKSAPGTVGESAGADPNAPKAPRTPAPPPGSAAMRRSGTRGK
jgi:hypothetical protein